MFCEASVKRFIVHNRRYFSTITAISYAIFLVIFGMIIFVGSAVENRIEIPEIGTLHPIPEVLIQDNSLNSYQQVCLFFHRFSVCSCFL